MPIKNTINRRGFVLLYALLVASVVLVIGLTLSNIILKQLQISYISRELNGAYYAANAGRECAQFMHGARQTLLDIREELEDAGFGVPSVDIDCADKNNSIVETSPFYEWGDEFSEDMFSGMESLSFKSAGMEVNPRLTCAFIQVGENISKDNFDYIWSRGYNFDCDVDSDRKVERILCQDFDLSTTGDCEVDV